MKILTFSTLYPNAAKPVHGIFVETRLRHLLSSGQVQSMVVAPVPWFPFSFRGFGEYAVHAKAPIAESRSGITVLHPRYPLIPKFGMVAAPFLLAQALKSTIGRLLKRFDFDAIDAHYLYPDGVAAVMLGRHFRKPVVITARGTDATLIPNYRLPRYLIRWAARKSAALITVSSSLKENLIRLGVGPQRITVLRNGVDLDRFHVLDREAARRELQMHRPTLLSVGHLIPRKGHDAVMRAVALLPGIDLVIVGAGPELNNLRALAGCLHISDRVRFTGALPQEQLPSYYAAADALVLASTREGWPNVLLEAMACGTPAIASNVDGASEIITTPEAGLLLDDRAPEVLARTIRHFLANPPERSATRRYAEMFSWESTTNGQIELFRRVLAERQGATTDGNLRAFDRDDALPERRVQNQ